MTTGVLGTKFPTVSINNYISPSSVALTVNDNGDTGTQTFTVTPAEVELGSPPAPLVEYSTSNIASLDVNGGNGGNKFNVTGTPSNCDTTIDTGSGGDSVILGANGSAPLGAQDLSGTIDIVSTASTAPALTVDDSLDTSTTSLSLGAGSLTGSLVNGATVNYSYLSSLTVKGGSGGSDTFTITGTPAGITTTLDTGTGTSNHTNETTVEATGAGSTLDIVGHNTQSSPDSVTLSNAHNAQGLLGTINIGNTPGTTSLTVDDSADTGTDERES